MPMQDTSFGVIVFAGQQMAPVTGLQSDDLTECNISCGVCRVEHLGLGYSIHVHAMCCAVSCAVLYYSYSYSNWLS